jgi:hypothetical protein
MHAREVRSGFPPPNRTQWALIVAAVVCYGVGYPVGLLAHSVVGWVFVSLGGVVLIVLAGVTIARVHRSVPARHDGADIKPAEQS